MSDFAVLVGGLMTTFVMGFVTGYGPKMIRRFFDQI